MAKGYSFVDLPTPGSLTATAVAGGSLTASTTYYYTVVGVYSTGTNNSKWEGKSIPSAEVSATTDATNKSVQLQFTSAVGACGAYRVFRSTTSGGYLNGYYPCLRWTPLDSVYNSGGTVTLTDDGTSLAGFNNYLDIVNTAHGRLTLSGSTSSDKFSIVDLYNADVAGGWGVITKTGLNTYLVNTYIVGHTGMYWYDIDKTIILADGWSMPTGASNSNFQFGNITSGRTSAGCNIDVCSTWHALIDFGTLYAYRTIFRYIYPFTTANLALCGTESISACVVKDCQIDRFRNFTPLSVADCTLTNVTYSRGDNFFDNGKGTFTNLVAYDGSRVFQSTTGTVFTARGVYSESNTGVVMIVGKNAEITLIDVVVASGGYLFATVDSTGTVVTDNFSFNLTVYEEGGTTGIDGASVKMYDKDDTLVVDTTTDGDGEITEQIVTRRNSTVSNTTITTTTMTPIFLVISADGYETYEEYMAPTTSAGITKTVSLKIYKPLRQTFNGNLLLANKPELGSSSKLLEI